MTGLLGVAVFFEKVSEVPVRELKLAIQLGTTSGEGWDMLRVLMLGIQLLSVTPTEEFEYQRLLQLIFARDDGILDPNEKTFFLPAFLSVCLSLSLSVCLSVLCLCPCLCLFFTCVSLNSPPTQRQKLLSQASDSRKQKTLAGGGANC